MDIPLLEARCGARDERLRAIRLGRQLYRLIDANRRRNTYPVRKPMAYGVVNGDQKTVYLDMTVTRQEAQRRGYPAEVRMQINRRDAWAAAEQAMADVAATQTKLVAPWEEQDYGEPEYHPPAG